MRTNILFIWKEARHVGLLGQLFVSGVGPQDRCWIAQVRLMDIVLRVQSQCRGSRLETAPRANQVSETTLLLMNVLFFSRIEHLSALVYNMKHA